MTTSQPSELVERREAARRELYECLCWFGTLPEPEGDVPERYHRWDDLGEIAERIITLLERLSSSEVTEEMIEAGRDAWCRDPCNADDEAVKRIYLAMRSAATSERKG